MPGFNKSQADSTLPDHPPARLSGKLKQRRTRVWAGPSAYFNPTADTLITGPEMSAWFAFWEAGNHSGTQCESRPSGLPRAGARLVRPLPP